MTGLPWWFQTVSHIIAIVFAFWVGLHLYAPVAWLVIFATTALVSAVLPVHRYVGFVGLGVTVVVAAWGGYLSREGWSALSGSALVDMHGGPIAGGRDLIMFLVGAGWLAAGSAIRIRRA